MTDYLIYEKRRKLLASNMHENSIAIIEASPEKIRNNDSTYRYRQCSNFYYLTGYNKSGAILVVQKKTNNVISHFYSKKPNKYENEIKKNLSDKIRISSLKGIGNCEYDIVINEDIIIQSLDYYNLKCDG